MKRSEVIKIINNRINKHYVDMVQGYVSTYQIAQWIFDDLKDAGVSFPKASKPNKPELKHVKECQPKKKSEPDLLTANKDPERICNRCKKRDNNGITLYCNMCIYGHIFD